MQRLCRGEQVQSWCRAGAELVQSWCRCAGVVQRCHRRGVAEVLQSRCRVGAAVQVQRWCSAGGAEEVRKRYCNRCRGTGAGGAEVVQR
jgi:hypothetical protein